MGLLGAEIQDMSVDQLAGAIVLVLGAIGSLLLVIWQSRCACKCRIGISDKCYIFDCSREPPPPPDEEGDKDKKEAKQQEPDVEKQQETDDSEEIVPKETEPEPEPQP